MVCSHYLTLADTNTDINTDTDANGLQPHFVGVGIYQCEHSINVLYFQAVLAARCSYFEAMFRSFMPEDSIVNVSQ